MWSHYVVCTFLPYAVRVGAFYVCCALLPTWPEGTRPKDHVQDFGQVFQCTGFMAVLTGLSYLVTDALVTHRQRSCRLLKSEDLIGVTLSGGLFAFLGLSFAFINSLASVIAVAILDGIFLLYILNEGRAYETFRDIFLQSQQLSQKQAARWRRIQEHRRACRLVVKFYREHPQLRQAVPPALFHSMVKADIPEGAEPEKAWAAARELIARLAAQVQSTQSQARRSKTHRPVKPEDV